jgi:hypothetical protein
MIREERLPHFWRFNPAGSQIVQFLVAIGFIRRTQRDELCFPEARREEAVSAQPVEIDANDSG